LKQKITQKFGLPCYDPANGVSVFINTTQELPVDLSLNLLKRQLMVTETEVDEKGEKKMGIIG
jgi:integrator complex subunit 11